MNIVSKQNSVNPVLAYLLRAAAAAAASSSIHAAANTWSSLELISVSCL
jgi:hypothetical protein